MAPFALYILISVMMMPPVMGACSITYAVYPEECAEDEPCGYYTYSPAGINSPATCNKRYHCLCGGQDCPLEDNHRYMSRVCPDDPTNKYGYYMCEPISSCSSCRQCGSDEKSMYIYGTQTHDRLNCLCEGMAFKYVLNTDVVCYDPGNEICEPCEATDPYCVEHGRRAVRRRNVSRKRRNKTH